MAVTVLDRLLTRKLQQYAPVPLRLRLWDGSTVPLARCEPRAELRIASRRDLLRLALSPEDAFGELYAGGSIEVHGELVALLTDVSRAAGLSRTALGRLSSWWLSLVQRDSRRGSRHNIHHHYDLGNDFYRQWLDETLNYTCAYFPSPSATLEEAQVAKMDYVCRKLRLRPGERVLEAGCGWGALARHMARNYGVHVRAFNISREQIAYARQQARQEGLDSLVEYVEDDYRNVRGRYDVFVSVGMLEHVGRQYYETLSGVIHDAIGRSGRGLLHFIGRNRPRTLNNWIRKRIFPGAYPPTLREVMPIFERNDYAVVDIENLRPHYAWTLEHWLERYERVYPEVAARFGERFARAWRLYLAGSTAAFRAGTMQLFQIVFAGQECEALPATRADLYSAQEQPWIATAS